MKRTTTFNLLTLTVFGALLVPAFVQEGLFLDGITYAAISKNLANGIGQFWEPHYTKTLAPNFSGHPPLVFILQSFFFKLLGDHFYTEKAFSLATAVLTALGIVLCWKELAVKGEEKSNYWLPILLWLLVPVVSWSYQNNMLENTVSVFTTFSVFLTARALHRDSKVLIPLSAVLLICAFLSKGFVGLFPMAVPVIYAVVFKQPRRSLLVFASLVVSLVVFSFGLLKLFPEVEGNISRYLEVQALPALMGTAEVTTDYRLSILVELLGSLSIIITITMVLWLITFRSKSIAGVVVNRKVIFYLVVAISASIPLIVSLKQRRFYLIPSIPFYALSFGFFINEVVNGYLSKLREKVLKTINGMLLFALSVLLVTSISLYGKFSRDASRIKDVRLISSFLEEGAIINCTKEIWRDWGLVAYFSRFGYISLDCVDEREYYLIKNEDKMPESFREVMIIGDEYTLLKGTAAR